MVNLILFLFVCLLIGYFMYKSNVVKAKEITELKYKVEPKQDIKTESESTLEHEVFVDNEKLESTEPKIKTSKTPKQTKIKSTKTSKTKK